MWDVQGGFYILFGGYCPTSTSYWIKFECKKISQEYISFRIGTFVYVMAIFTSVEEFLET